MPFVLAWLLVCLGFSFGLAFGVVIGLVSSFAKLLDDLGFWLGLV